MPGYKAGPDTKTFKGQDRKHDNKGDILQTVQTNSTNLMILPLSEELRNFVGKCQAENVALYQGLTKMYYM